jgi:DNA-binding MarR family transcriptional regulator
MTPRPDRQVVDEALLSSIERLIFAAIGITTDALAASAGATELSLTQWRILALLDRGAGGLRLGEVAATIGMSVPSASRMVDRLEARGLVAARPDPDDRRAVRLGLTPEGELIVADVMRSRRRLISDRLVDIRVSKSFAKQLDQVSASLLERPMDRQVA